MNENQDKEAVSELAKGNSVRLVGKGGSMHPLIKIGESYTVTPYANQTLSKGDIVFVRVKKNKYLSHKILDIDNGKYTISNIAGKIDAVVTIDAILGIVAKIGIDDEFVG